MFVKEYKGRRYYVCNECNKPYSFRVGKWTDSWMETYCHHCRQRYPEMLKKNAKV